MSILKEFKDFALKGNVMDLAIGIIIGAAFGKTTADDVYANFTTLSRHESAIGFNGSAC